MMKEQLIPAFIAALMVEGAETKQIERAVERVRQNRLGESIFDNSLHRAFAFEQTDLLKKAL